MIQSSVENICHNTGSFVVRRDIIAYIKDHLGNSILLHTHIKSVAKSRVTSVCSNSFNAVINRIICFYEVWTPGIPWSVLRLLFIEPKIPPKPPVLGANLLENFQEITEPLKLVLLVILLCIIGSRKSGLCLCVPLPREKVWCKGLSENICR